MSTSKSKKIFIAGHNGLVGSALVRALSEETNSQLITANRSEVDLCSQQETLDFILSTKPDYIYLAAAKVGGIYANNSYPADFIYENLMIASNVIHAAWRAKTKKLLFLGSSCIYPKQAAQPMHESTLLAGQLEATNEPYAIAKIAGIKLCESYNRQYGTDFRSIMPTNLYGPGDNFHPNNSHVIPGLIRRIHEAKANNLNSVSIWGSGKVKREFLHVDDMANACLALMSLDKSAYQSLTSPMLSHINAGYGSDIAISELADLICKVVDYKGSLEFDTSKPDGTPRKLLDSSKLLSTGWQPSYSLEAGLADTYAWYLAQVEEKEMTIITP